jgi:hypothetical protein
VSPTARRRQQACARAAGARTTCLWVWAGAAPPQVSRRPARAALPSTAPRFARGWRRGGAKLSQSWGAQGNPPPTPSGWDPRRLTSARACSTRWWRTPPVGQTAATFAASQRGRLRPAVVMGRAAIQNRHTTTVFQPPRSSPPLLRWTWRLLVTSIAHTRAARWTTAALCAAGMCARP